jgi:hypothetical protein
MSWEGNPARSDRSASPEASLKLPVDAACQSFEAGWKALNSDGIRRRIKDRLVAAEEAER